MNRYVLLSKVRFGRRRAGRAFFEGQRAYVDARSRSYWGPALKLR